MNRNRQKSAWMHMAAMLAVGLLAFSAHAAVSVKVYQASEGGGVRYSYRVINDSEQPIVGVKIGFDYLHGEPELVATPRGWTLADGIPASSVASPPGWVPRIVTMEESDYVNLEWTSDDGAQYDIAPGATKTGFLVLLDSASSAYANAHFDVVFGDSTHEYATLVADNEPPPPPGDTTPPQLSVSLSPSTVWPPNRKMVHVTATISVSDDSDPNPGVRLLSVTCNEAVEAGDIAGAATGTDDRQFDVRAARTGQRKEGRVYTALYEAVDAAGNRTTAAATVTIPHDQRP